jgi:Multidrug resistance efflux pump
MGILALLGLAAASYGGYYVLVGRFYVSTDDAYVRANNTMLGARVSGHIAAILPADNTVVRTGDVVFRIDDGDYRIAADAARTRIATQQATIDRIGRQVTAQESAVEQAKAQLASAEAALKRAGLDFERQQALSTKGFASRATYEVSEAGRDQGMAAVKSAQAAYDAARDNVEVDEGAAGRSPRPARGIADLARQGRTRSSTSPRCGRRSTAPSPTASSTPATSSRPAAARQSWCRSTTSSSTPISRKPSSSASVRPAGDDLGRRLRPSQVRGVVDSIRPRRVGVHAAAAGQRHRQLHQDRAAAAGRIRVPKDVAKQNLLRAGMSVYATVDTNKGAADADSEADLDAPATTDAK